MHPYLLLSIIYLAFISLGLPDSVLGVSWPPMRASLGMPLEVAGYIAIILTSCSAISSVVSGPINRRFGTGRVVLVSSILTASGLLGYSIAPSFAWVLVAALPLGFGQGGVDSSLNGYVAANYASRHMNWLHASWGIGATLGPIVMTTVMASGATWRIGYRSLSAVQGFLALLFLLSLGLWVSKGAAAKRAQAEDESKGEEGTDDPHAGLIHGMKHSEPWIQIGMYALYAACEFTVGIWTASMLVEARGLKVETAGLLVAIYYASITGGRILTGFVADRLGNRTMVRTGLGLAFAGAALLSVRLPWTAPIALLFLGLGFAPVYPCLMHETPRRFDRHTYRTVIGFQVGAACLGGSFIPTAVGFAAARISLELVAPFTAAFIAALLILGARLDKTT
jgi:fucose permease